MNQDRRQFLGALGVAVLSVQCLPAIALASGESNQGGVADDPVVIHSGPGAFSHVHDLLIPYALLRTPATDRNCPHLDQGAASPTRDHAHTA